MLEILASVTQIIGSLLAVALILVAAHGIGHWLAAWLRVGNGDRLAAVVWKLSLGMLAGGTALALAGVVGLLFRPLIVILSFTVAACEVFRWLAVRSMALSSNRGGAVVLAAAATDEVPAPPRWFASVAGCLATIALVGTLASALAPPTAGDALCYHLDLPKRCLQDHALVFSSWDDHCTYPLLVEMWYLWGLAVEGPVAAQLLHFSAGVLVCLAAVLLCTPLLGRRWGWVCGALVLLVPGINNQMTAPLNDVGVALFCTLALVAWQRAAADPEDRRAWMLCGLMTGGALASKYLAMLFAGALAILFLIELGRRPRFRAALLTGAGVAGSFLLLTCALWYLRAVWHRGNPVYPFFHEWIGTAAPVAMPASKTPLGWNLADVVSFPWRVVMQPQTLGGRGHQLGPLFLMLLPALLLTRRLRGLGALLVVALVYLVGWYTLRQNVRFLAPVVAVLAVAAGWVLVEFRRLPRAARVAAWSLVVVAVVPLAVLPAYRARHTWPVAVGVESREDYLTRSEPTYVAATILNQVSPEGGRVLSQDFRAFYFDAQVVQESAYRRRIAYADGATDAGPLARALLRDGFTHLLLAENEAADGIRYDPTLSRVVDRALARGVDDDENHLLRLAEYRFDDVDGGRRRYRLFMLR